jgi:hypothetical protein
VAAGEGEGDDGEDNKVGAAGEVYGTSGISIEVTTIN